MRQRYPESLGILSSSITGLREDTGESMVHALHHQGQVHVHKGHSAPQLVQTCKGEKVYLLVGEREKESVEVRVQRGRGVSGNFEFAIIIEAHCDGFLCICQKIMQQCLL